MTNNHPCGSGQTMQLSRWRAPESGTHAPRSPLLHLSWDRAPPPRWRRVLESRDSGNPKCDSIVWWISYRWPHNRHNTRLSLQGLSEFWTPDRAPLHSPGLGPCKGEAGAPARAAGLSRPHPARTHCHALSSLHTVGLMVSPSSCPCGPSRRAGHHRAAGFIPRSQRRPRAGASQVGVIIICN